MLPLITDNKAPLKCARFEKVVGTFSSRSHVDAKNDSVSTQLTRMQLGAMLLVTEQLPVTNWRKSFKSLTSALSRNERSIWIDLFEALLLSSPGNCSRFFHKIRGCISYFIYKQMLKQISVLFNLRQDIESCQPFPHLIQQTLVLGQHTVGHKWLHNIQLVGLLDRCETLSEWLKCEGKWPSAWMNEYNPSSIDISMCGVSHNVSLSSRTSSIAPQKVPNQRHHMVRSVHPHPPFWSRKRGLWVRDHFISRGARTIRCAEIAEWKYFVNFAPFGVLWMWTDTIAECEWS